MSNRLEKFESLPDPAPDSTFQVATPSFTGAKGHRIVPKRRFQKGTFVGMWRLDVLLPDGTIKRKQRSKSFVGLSERQREPRSNLSWIP